MDLIVNGTSLAALGVITENQTEFKKPKRRTQRSYIAGTDGAQSEEYGYDGYDLEYRITPTLPEYFNQIFALLDGDVILEASDDPGKFWYARVDDEVPYSSIALWKTTTVKFFVYNPFRYVKDEVDQTITTFPATIVNAGTAESNPLLKITGSGTVNLTLNGTTVEYTFDTPYVYFECIKGPLRKAYHETTNKTRNKSGGWPVLSPGNNTLTINSGTVTQVIVKKRTRYK
ncbi:MAG TPA: hypothetical protein DCQ90_06420 [Erysipelotrichaceae bacterium]|nr:hypothetical protein [Erysipelotrichaceae bacterium]